MPRKHIVSSESSAILSKKVMACRYLPVLAEGTYYRRAHILHKTKFYNCIHKFSPRALGSQKKLRTLLRFWACALSWPLSNCSVSSSLFLFSSNLNTCRSPPEAQCHSKFRGMTQLAAWYVVDHHKATMTCSKREEEWDIGADNVR